MKKLINLLLPLLLLGALCLPSLAQDEEGAAPKEKTAAPAKPAAKPAAKKPARKAAARKKPAKKKKPEPPVSEYKFSSGESAPTYKFDKKGDPIVKAVKKKKPAKKAAAKTNKAAPKTDAKLKTSKPIGAEEPPAQGQTDQSAVE